VIVKAPVPQDNDNIADSGSVLPVEPAILTDPPSI